MLCADEWSAAWPGQAGHIVLPDFNSRRTIMQWQVLESEGDVVYVSGAFRIYRLVYKFLTWTSSVWQLEHHGVVMQLPDKLDLLSIMDYCERLDARLVTV